MPDPDQEDAIAWAVRTADPAFDAWDDLAAWLDGDPARASVYRDAVAGIDETVAVMAAHSPVAEVVPIRPRAISKAPPAWRRWWPAGGVALAAGIAAAMLVGRPDDVDQRRVIETAAGRPQRIALADGSAMEIAGGSRVTLDPAQPRRATLDRGSAMFSVRHDDAAPFRVTAGHHVIVDVGTAFEVVQRMGVTDVAVAEGAVVVDPAAQALRLAPGQAVTLRDGAAPVLRSVVPGAVAQWRNDRMSYRDAPLSQVAADLSAALGHPVVPDAGLKGRRFSGTLVVATVRGRPGELAALLDVAVHGDARGWELRAR